MEPVTHFLTGACIGRAGLNRKTAYATLAAVLAAEAADLDVIWGFAGPVEELRHHRGITHTFIAIPVVAGVIVGTVWLMSRWQRRGFPPFPRKETERMRHGGEASGRESRSALAQKVHWGWLYCTTLIAALSHILLDWTNNYGVRPFFPFNPRWYEGSFVFIAEPVLWVLLLLALVMPWLLGLADREIGARRKPFRGRGWAVFALAGMVTLWCWRWGEHAQGIAMIQKTQVATEPILRVALEPYPVNPYRWHAILETKDFYQTAEVNTWNPGSPGAIDTDPQRDVLYKPADTPAVETAKRTLLGRVYLDWGRWALVRDLGPEPVPGMDPPALPPNRRWTTVEFSDLRFSYRFLASQRETTRVPLSGWVYIVDGTEDAGEAMGGREQH
ncbi:MAG TPA: metal-dependent hydrolase [Terracidiphilus sp.]|nr:metal-dependent hydrolase [Terracidiphilus sp.]